MPVEKICTGFKKKYGSPRLGNKANPLNEYLYILLSLRTTYWSFEKVYLSFKRTYPRWEDVYRADKRKIAKTIKDAGLSNQKAAHIKQALKKIKDDFGSLSLKSLKHAGDTEAEEYLMSLPGLGKKAARCIMLYSLGRDILPVDTHTQRVAERLGFISRVDNKKAHDLLDRKVPKKLSYIFHVGCVVHGRTICLHHKPKCGECFMSEYCKNFKERGDADRGKARWQKNR